MGAASVNAIKEHNARELISPEYKAQQDYLHKNTNYGVASIKYAGLVTEIINRLEITHLLDYGCGAKMNLGKHIKPAHKLQYQAYDPCVEELAGMPVPAQMVACIDVLEHIEPEFLDNVLDHIAKLTEAVAFMTVHTGPAGKTLPDGRNAHIIQEPMEWWIPKFTSRFELQTVQVRHHQAFYVIGHPKARIEGVDGSKLAA
jgi:hypothetical protein